MGTIRHFNKIQFLPYKERIGDISVSNFWMDENGVPQSAQSHLDIPPFSYFGIDKHYPNEYYGKESEYVWDDYKGMYKSNTYKYGWISPSSFIYPEHKYTLARWTDMDDDELTPDLKFVSSRPFELTEEEQQAFWELAKRGQAHIEKVLKIEPNYLLARGE